MSGLVEDRVDRALVAVDDVEDAGRQACLDHQFGQADRHGRITLGRLQDEGVAAGDRRGEHPHRDHGREVERRDAGADADGLADRVHVDAGAGTFGELALLQMRNADDEFADFQAAHEIALGVFDRLAVLAREDLGQLVHVGVEKFDELHEHAGAALRVGGCPLRLRGLGAGDGSAEFRVACQRHGALHFARCRVEDVARAPAGAGDALAIDEMTEFVHGCLLLILIVAA